METQRIISSISLIVQNSSAQLKFKKYWLQSFKNNLWSSGDSFNWEDINSYRNFFILVTTGFDKKTDFDKKTLFQLNLSDVTFCSNRSLLSFNFKLGNNCSHIVGKRFVILITFATFSVFCLMFCRIFLVIKKKKKEIARKIASKYYFLKDKKNPPPQQYKYIWLYTTDII